MVGALHLAGVPGATTSVRGDTPALIGGPAVFVAVEIGVTVPVPPLVKRLTYTVRPLGVITIESGHLPILTGWPARFVAVWTGVTVPAP